MPEHGSADEAAMGEAAEPNRGERVALWLCSGLLLVLLIGLGVYFSLCQVKWRHDAIKASDRAGELRAQVSGLLSTNERLQGQLQQLGDRLRPIERWSQEKYPNLDPATAFAKLSKDIADSVSRAAQEDEVRAALFDFLLRFQELYSRETKLRRTYFLSVDGEDPGDALFARLSDRSPPLKKVSQCVKDAVRVRDKETGDDGVIVNIGPLMWLDISNVAAYGGYYWHGLAEQGSYYSVTRTDGTWTARHFPLFWRR